MNNYLSDIQLAPPGGFKGFGTIGLENANTSSAGKIFTTVISTVVGVMTVVGIIWFVIQFFIGALGIIFSGGDKAKLAEAKTKLSTSLIGLVVVIAAIFIIELVGTVLGIEGILNINNFINQLGGVK
jgi:hypothetical protein